MANKILTPDMITLEALRLFENTSVVTRNCYRQYDDKFAQEGAKIGDTLRVRMPGRYLVRDGAVFQGQDAVQQNTTLTVSSQKHVALEFTSAELTMSLDKFSDNILKPAVSQLAATVDSDVCLGIAKQIAQSVGTPGTTPATSQVLLSGQQKLDEAAVPRDQRYVVVNPAANAQLVEGLKGLFNPSGTISSQFKTGLITQGVLGYDEVAMSQSIGTFTTGSRTAGATVTTTVATQGQATLAITTNGATDTIKQGDVFTIANVFAVNPQTRLSTGSLYQFVVQADAVAVGSAVTVTVQPIYTATEALATVDSFPVATAAVTWIGSASTAYPQNLIYQKDAIAFATADLILPKSTEMASRMNNGGVAMRFIRAYDPIQDQMVNRLDVLYGYKLLRLEGAVRLWG